MHVQNMNALFSTCLQPSISIFLKIQGNFQKAAKTDEAAVYSHHTGMGHCRVVERDGKTICMTLFMCSIQIMFTRLTSYPRHYCCIRA